MIFSYKRLFYLLIIVLLPACPGVASDLEKEKRWSEQITDALLVGDAVKLEAGGTPFLGIYTEASEGPTGRAVILAHGIGIHPDWPEVINPLRSELPEHGWSTLSIQMPVLPNDAALKDYAPLFDEAPPRIEAAAGFLREKGNKIIVLAGHSLGAAMAAGYFNSKGKVQMNGLIVIGLGVIEVDDKMNAALALEKVNIPVLDIYGSRDLPAVLDSVKTRAKAARKAGNNRYRQLEIEGADHFFVGMEDALIRRIYGWLKSHYENPAR